MSDLNVQSPTTADERLWAAQDEIKRLKAAPEKIAGGAAEFGDTAKSERDRLKEIAKEALKTA